MAMVVSRFALLRLARPNSLHSYALSSSPSLSKPKECQRPTSPAPLFLVRCMSSESADAPRVPARLAQARQLLEESEQRSAETIEEVPKVSLEHVTVSFARSGGPGGQNVNKVNTKVDMRFKVEEANWLPQRIKEKILQNERKRINSEGELVISSTKTRTQKGNIEDALSKLQAVIDAAAYVPPPPSEETKNKINRLARIENQRRLDTKKKSSMKKANRRAGGWD
ncbi:hypothetical protein KP509_37G068800 [Ceratopteris richardii]|uniref:Prokaryotic-type class I peptide chain release factors domain-containing protein n=1 Tax=Ceratopteris richardii TaxID=49495 RepID=A0A8T2QAC1_CERRI|nr:hypothetical protein KP509_37G068800 [Ceratopteris richardii]KAH7280463.1 hypothetical protein KP509_37G068800 [Ceratopteris richardii]